MKKLVLMAMAMSLVMGATYAQAAKIGLMGPMTGS